MQSPIPRILEESKSPGNWDPSISTPLFQTKVYVVKVPIPVKIVAMAIQLKTFELILLPSFFIGKPWSRKIWKFTLIRQERQNHDTIWQGRESRKNRNSLRQDIKITPNVKTGLFQHLRVPPWIKKIHSCKVNWKWLNFSTPQHYKCCRYYFLKCCEGSLWKKDHYVEKKVV